MMRNARIELDLGTPDLAFMCPKCFAVNRINVEQHMLHVNTTAWISLDLNPCSNELVYQNLIRAVHNCKENRTDRKEMIWIDSYLDTILPEFNTLGFSTTYGRCSTDSYSATNPFIEFDIGPDDPHSCDIRTQLCKAIIAARKDVFSRFDETRADYAVAKTMRCDFEIMCFGQRLRITSDPTSVNPKLGSCPTVQIPDAFVRTMRSVLYCLEQELNRSAKNKSTMEDDEDVR